jgi:serine/threonine protein kinase
MTDRVGQQLGNYRLIRLLGRGGFAEVYLGEHIHLGTQAAIKVLHTQLARDDEDKFRAEARTIARLIHPHIVRVFDFGLEDTTPFIVMDFAPNGSLRYRHPEGTKLPLNTIVLYLKQISDALQYIHNQKLIHRDIKPQNMLVGPSNEILLSDFGIAIVAQSSRLQHPQDVAGTVAYMAPEQLNGKPRPASDQYALGVVVYEWLSGTRPFKGSYGEIASQHALASPPSLHKHIPTISSSVEDVVMKALAKDPAQRFGSVQDFAYELVQVSYEDNSVAQKAQHNFANSDSTISPQNQPIRVTHSTSVHSIVPSAPLAAGRREPQPIIQPLSARARNVSVKPAVQQTRKPISTKTSRTVTKPPPDFKGASANSNHRGRRIGIIAGISLAVLVCALIAFFFYGTNATVTIVVPSQSLSVTRQYTASTDQHTTQQNTIPSQVLSSTASATGTGTATSAVQQGNQVASGTVAFTNKGNTSLDIPTGTLLSTSGAVAVQFVTTADAFVEPASSSTFPFVVPVQAQLPGLDGNVAANSITIIPPDSLIKIAQSSQIPSAAVNLTVTNPNAMTGGGASNVPAVSTTDVNFLAQTLQKPLQNEISIWLAKSVSPGDVAGTPMPNVLASSTPLPEEKMMTTPAVGQPAPGGKFTGVLRVTVSVQVIRNAAIQTAGTAQLDAAAQHKNPPYVLVTQLPFTVRVTRSTPSTDGTTLSITVLSSGQIVPQVSTQELSNQLTGKNKVQAQSFITSGQPGIKGVVSASIVIFPSFWSIMPFRPEQIHNHRTTWAFDRCTE